MRHEIVRAGERQPLDALLRRAVARRDQYICQEPECGSYVRPEDVEIDHVTPWSAGGPDAGTNLRVLCRRHNQERSNYVDLWSEERRYLPVTWWCIDCWTSREQHDTWHTERGERCYPLAAIGSEIGIRWSTHPYLDPAAPLVLAFCAHCNCTGYTTDPL